MCYSYSCYKVASSCVGCGIGCLRCLPLYFAELWSMLVQTMAVCFVLVLTALLYCGSYLVETMRECISLFLPGISVDSFIRQAPEVCVHPHVSCLMLLVNTVGILWVLWNVVSSWYKRKQILGEAILKRALKQPVPEWQGVWKDLGRFLGWLSPPIA